MLLDSNILIYSILPENLGIRDLIRANNPSVSEVSRVEVMGFHKLTEPERLTLEGLFAICDILPLTREISDRGIALRQTRKMGLGDSIIAATALIHTKVLVTANTKDFQWIAGLRLLNPTTP
jgi:predicted nucleic acid-binding protein